MTEATLRAPGSAKFALAHNLGMTVVAEGSEKAQDLPMLKDLSCEVGQGYVFARPMEGEAVVGLIAKEPEKRGEE